MTLPGSLDFDPGSIGEANEFILRLNVVRQKWLNNLVRMIYTVQNKNFPIFSKNAFCGARRKIFGECIIITDPIGCMGRQLHVE